MDRSRSIVDINWPEVRLINGFALLMGYLLRGVKGLGVLVVTWTTVVLLGGYVSVLEKKDFWSLTVITLVQIIGAVDFYWTERQSNAGFVFRGSRDLTFATFIDTWSSVISLKTLTAIVWMLQLLLFAITLWPLLILYVFGVYISAGLSLWRLIGHDYSNVDGGANLKAALQVLYSLAIAQGVLFGYKAIYALVATITLVKEVGGTYFPDQPSLVSDYINVTVKGCEKDTTFARGRNLVTYAVDLLVEKSPEKYLSGVSILGSLVKPGKPDLVDQRMMIRQLMTASESFSHMIQKLLETLVPGSAYSKETREHAARIVAHVASGICLEQFPRGVQCISSLLHTASEEDEHSWAAPNECESPCLLPDQYKQNFFLGSSAEDRDADPVDGDKELLRQGLLTFWKLADDEDNCRVISNTQGLLSKLTAPLVSGRTHSDHPKEWPEIAEVSMELMSRLMAAPGETGVKLRHEISSNEEAIRTVEGILKCDGCGAELKKQAIGVLLDLSVDTSSILANEGSSIIFIITLLNLFLFGTIKVHQPPPEFQQKQSQLVGRYNSSSIHWMKKRTENANLAAERLLAMLSSGSETRSATLILQAAVHDEAVSSLTRAAIRVKSNKHRMSAAEILKHLCTHYTKDDEYLKELKKVIAEVMPKVLREILGYGQTREEIQTVTEANHPQFSASGTDLEIGASTQYNGQKNLGRDGSFSHQKKQEKYEGSKLQEALISLCVAISNRWLKADHDLVHQFDEMAAKICLERRKPVKTFTLLVDEAHELLKKKA